MVAEYTQMVAQERDLEEGTATEKSNNDVDEGMKKKKQRQVCLYLIAMHFVK